jgi:integrase
VDIRPINRKQSKEHKESQRTESHVIHLAPQAVEILRALNAVIWHSTWVFPSHAGTGKHIAGVSLSKAWHRMEFGDLRCTAHK